MSLARRKLEQHRRWALLSLLALLVSEVVRFPDQRLVLLRH